MIHNATPFSQSCYVNWLCHITGQPSRSLHQMSSASQSSDCHLSIQADQPVGLHYSAQSNQCQSAQAAQESNNYETFQQGTVKYKNFMN